MPELPEVETIARTLAPGVIGRTIAGIELIYRPLVRTGRKKLETMRGRRVLGVRRRGKMLLIECEGGRTLVFHLKMTGQFLLAAPSDERDKHTRLIIRFADAKDELRFSDVRKFGFLLCLEGEPESACGELACLGPEPLEISLPEFAGVLEGRRGRIKACSSTRPGSPASATSTPTRCSSTPASTPRRRPICSRDRPSSGYTGP